MVFVEMPNCTQTLTASKPAPVFTSRVAAMAPTSMSSSVLTSAHELLGGLLSRYITILFPTPMMDVLLLDCAATVHEGQRNQNMAELEVVVRAEPARTQPWMPSLAGRATTLLCAVRGHHEEKGYKSVEYDIWTGFLIRKQDGGSANYGNNCTSHLESFHSDAESNVSLDLNVARRALTMCIIIAGQSPSLVDGVGFQSFVSALNRLVPVSRPTFDQDLMTLYGREKDALHSTISETFDAGWKLQRRIVGFKFMEITDDDNFIVVVLPYLASKGPWPPPDELRLTSCDVELRPTPWPTFIMAEWFSVNSYCGRLWKPPWPIQICQQINIFHEFTLQWCFVFDCGKCLQLGGLHLLLSLSMVGCALIHKLVQRKCGGNCWCFLLEVAGQQSQVVGGKTRDHWRAEQDLLQQFLSSGTTVGSSGNLLALVALMVMDDKPTVRWVHSTDLISDQTYKLLNVFCDYKSLVHSFPQCDKILDIANTEALILSSTQQ
ncbi:hypothetical protein SORBI_3003G195700 [Sorghum bicolor]|uniref:Uncharacterized protein n=1 Tax=Sorghum bicolor TaxID=4558 RepID=A0A1W0VY52_SORBI|nr:hypothetical protein SORBI_3003G195700 [Sorghum bicolor]